jgi:hypothetical protein
MKHKEGLEVIHNFTFITSMPSSTQHYLQNIKMDMDTFGEGDEGMFYDCLCCKRTNIYIGELLYCERCGCVFCIHCDIAESMRLAHPDWPCPQCPHIDVD